MDILFKNDHFVFSYRVGGILKHNGKILLQRPKNDDYAIIGGHVAAMETSMETLKREFEEEIHAKIEVDNLLAIGEIYFPWGKRPCHQICLYEVPGGHREAGEDILETAKRELQEETGAIKFEIKPICIYSVIGKTRVNDTGEETFGLLCFAEITEFAKELHSEMEKVVLMDELPENWTYPLIQPKLIEKYKQIEKQSYSQIQLVENRL